MTSSVTSPMLTADRSLTSPLGTARLQFRCPTCQNALLRSESYSQLACTGCGFLISQVDGIFRAVAPDRELHFRQFIREYEMVRAKEGRGSVSSAFYLELPYKDLTRRNSWQWQIRAQTFRCVERRIFPAIQRAYPLGCDVLDMGAGNCWLSYRMALRGHRPVAVDLLDNDADGLGAAKHYFSFLPAPFPRFLAEMDRLPFASAQFDVVVFNASFHYSVDYVRTFSEALRCLRSPGYVIIADSPFYARDESGQTMLEEKRAGFERQFGFRSDSIPSREYLTPASLNQLAETFSLHWNILRPWYGLKWAIRPLKARLLRRREPSRFHLFWTRVPHQ
jgi:SAM-dependent methyltransferase